MRQARLKAPDHHDVAYCHGISRVVNRAFVLGAEEREQFVEMMRCYEHFCGVRVLTYGGLSNHFHLLLAVPRQSAQLPGDEELLARANAVAGNWSTGARTARSPKSRPCARRFAHGCGI